MRLESMYQEVILDHYKHPHGRGLREPFGAEVHHVNPTCGDEITLRAHLAVGEDGRFVVDDISYDGQGCSISQASTSVLYDQIVGMPLDEALRTVEEFNLMVSSRGTVEGDEDVLGDGIAFGGVSKYPARVKCALLGWMAFKDAVVRIVEDPDRDGPAEDDVARTEGQAS
ncbi:Fe-S cluster assembly sulfur transfer protein SufU [Rhodococcus spongiicola]|uniref:SUF system NifU family Fe-S cluster assembly protein n=1 Tax=Rhodococcus spongiicola TaxID=2487352 RepID=A0A438AXF2_9NOCA|nr:SUF system NifU family Fe-S cluster assembly protein [Rhodococcus spongiicola]RVW03369.1 SUF system NifU family Fe-S cluster assembly protein [Rhodococcus spongiicola]